MVLTTTLGLCVSFQDDKWDEGPPSFHTRDKSEVGVVPDHSEAARTGNVVFGRWWRVPGTVTVSCGVVSWVGDGESNLYSFLKRRSVLQKVYTS